MADKKGWKDLPCGAIIEDLGAVLNNKTGAWRSMRPVWNEEKCISCLTCWIYCPEGSIVVEDGKMTGIDYDYCKGCGICAKVCPTKVHAIDMERERK